MLGAVKVFSYTVSPAELGVVNDPGLQEIQDAVADELHTVYHQRPGRLDLILALGDDLAYLYHRPVPFLLRAYLRPLADSMYHVLEPDSVQHGLGLGLFLPAESGEKFVPLPAF